MDHPRFVVGQFLTIPVTKELPNQPAPNLSNPAQLPDQPTPALYGPAVLPDEPAPALKAPADLPEQDAPALKAPLAPPDMPSPALYAPVDLPDEPAPALYAPVALPDEPAPMLYAPTTLPDEPAPMLYAPTTLPDEPAPGLYAPVALPDQATPGLYAPATLPDEPTPGLYAPVALPDQNPPGLSSPATLPDEPPPGLYAPAALPDEPAPMLYSPADLPAEAAPMLTVPATLPVEPAPSLYVPATLPAEAAPSLSVPATLPVETAPALSLPATLPAEAPPPLSIPSVLPAEAAPPLRVPNVLPAEPAPALRVPDILPVENAPALKIPAVLPAEPAPALRVPNLLPVENPPALSVPAVLPAEVAPSLYVPIVLPAEVAPPLSVPATLPVEAAPALSVPAVLAAEPAPNLYVPNPVAPTPSGDLNLYQPTVLAQDGTNVIQDVIQAVGDVVSALDDAGAIPDLSQTPVGQVVAAVVNAGQSAYSAAANAITPPQFAPSTDSSIVDNEIDYASPGPAQIGQTVGALLSIPFVALEMLQDAMTERNPYNPYQEYETAARFNLANLINAAIGPDGKPLQGVSVVGDVTISPGQTLGGIGGVSTPQIAALAGNPALGANTHTPPPAPFASLVRAFTPGRSSLNAAEQRPLPLTTGERYTFEGSSIAAAAFAHGLIPAKFPWDNDSGFLAQQGTDDGSRDNQSYLPFVFTDLRPIGNTYRAVWLRPMNLKIRETFSPEWNKRTYFGRVDPVVTYVSTGRALSVSFLLACFGPEDLRTVWQKLNWLSSMVYPSYDNDLAYSSGPVLRLRVGDVINSLGIEGNRGLPGIVETMEFDYSEALWELKKGWKVPRNIPVQLTFQILHDRPIGIGSNGQFGGLGQFDSQGNYLPPGAATTTNQPSPGNGNSNTSPEPSGIQQFRDIGGTDINNGYGQQPSSVQTPGSTGN
ncbi:MAG: hypothetical protein ACYDHY_07800 [Acidiferrobacterales bacterium]